MPRELQKESVSAVLTLEQSAGPSIKVIESFGALQERPDPKKRIEQRNIPMTSESIAAQKVALLSSQSR